MIDPRAQSLAKKAIGFQLTVGSATPTKTLAALIAQNGTLRAIGSETTASLQALLNGNGLTGAAGQGARIISAGLFVPEGAAARLLWGFGTSSTPFFKDANSWLDDKDIPAAYWPGRVYVAAASGSLVIDGFALLE